ncbi:MAG: 6-carboxytetrahydropterin synthase [Candidatus Sericytochromatia bacterium]
MKTTTIELFKEGMKFSAGHFTIFSETERENLHGHNFNVYVSITAEILENGMCFDYGIYKKRISKLCKEWNEVFILPTKSPYLQIEEDSSYIYALFNKEKIPFLKRDVLLLPIVNATLEEFSSLMIDKLISDKSELEKFKIKELVVKVFSGPGQCALAKWSI